MSALVSQPGSFRTDELFKKNTYRTCLLYLKMQGHFKTYSPVYSIEKKHASEIVGTPY